MQDSQTINITRSGSVPSRKGPAENFTGSVRVDPLFEAIAPADTFGANVTFEPGARSAWHTHPLGQTLIVTAGVGRVQGWGGADRGDAARRCRPDSARSETLARSLAKYANDAYRDRGTARRQEHRVDGKGQRRAVRHASAGATVGIRCPCTLRPRCQRATDAGQRAIGDIAPKLVELTDNVLFGDVWERPQLSKRDRSLVTVAALIAMNRPDQLRSHLVRARENGVTQEELIETITHLAFYAGWPNAVTAIAVAREVFEKK